MWENNWSAAAAADDDDDDNDDDDDDCIVTDGSHQRDDWCVESNQRDDILEAEAVGSSQAWNI